MRWLLPLSLSASLVVLVCCMPAEEADDASDFRQTVVPTLRRTCLECHQGDKAKGELRLDRLTTPASLSARQWQAIQERLDDRTMPPAGKPQPSASERQALTAWIGRQAPSASGDRALLRRLNRVEYANTLRDLLAVDLDLAELLPEDGKAAGFDNVDVGLDLTAPLLERYFEAADRALASVLGTEARPPSTVKRVDPSEISRGLMAKGKPPLFDDARTEADCLVYIKDPPSPPKVIRDLEAPVAGLYRYRIRAAAWHDPDQRVSLRVQAGYGDSNRSWLVDHFDVANEPTTIEFTQRLQRRDSLNLCANGVTRRWNLPKDHPGPGVAVYWVEREGPLPEPGPTEGLKRLLGDVNPDRGTLANAEAVLKRFARRAYRRPVGAADLAVLMPLVRARLEGGAGFREALRVGLTAVLCGPDFLYLRSSPGRLRQHELAARLSYFLWSSTPDDELLDLADQGRLDQPEVLRAQVERLLGDGRARAFTENFVGQWLNLRALKATGPDARLYPEFDSLLESSLPRETYAFFNEILAQDRSLLEFVHSDWAMLNGRLAELYGIPGVKKMAIRKVALPAGSHRGGVLTQASVLKVTANGTSTSPVVRGLWVLDRILGQPAPAPPANVPAIEPDIRGATTIREQLEKHRAVAACAGCHSRIDPPGFALECFDPIGGYRERYRVMASDRYRSTRFLDNAPVAYADGPAVSCSGELPGGRAFADIDAFKQRLLEDKDQLARALAGRLLVYATGHAIGPGDRAAVDGLVAVIKPKQYGFRSLVHAVVQSETFRSK